MKKTLLALAALAMLGGCAPKAPALHIVPAPLSVQMARGTFDVQGISLNCDPAMDARSAGAVQRFADELSLACGKACEVSEDGRGMRFVQDDSIAPEAYSISIRRSAAEGRGSGFSGVL